MSHVPPPAGGQGQAGRLCLGSRTGVWVKDCPIQSHSPSPSRWESCVSRSLPPVELLSGSASRPTTPIPRFASTLSPGPVLPLSASGVAAARPQLDMHLPGAARERRGPRTSRVAGADAAEQLSLASSDREHWNASAFLPERHRSPREGGDAHGPARASLTGVQLLGGRAELRIFRDSVSNIRAFGRSA